MPSFVVKDSVAFVTGTNKPNGIGRAIVDALLTHGASKVYATARDASQLDELVASHGSGKVVPVTLDVTDVDALADLSSSYPDVTIVVNNAGFAGFKTSIQDVVDPLIEIKTKLHCPNGYRKELCAHLCRLASD